MILDIDTRLFTDALEGVNAPILLALTLSTRNEGRNHQFVHYSHSVYVVGLLCVSLVLLKIEAEKRTTEPPGSKAEVHHGKPAPVETSRTLAKVHLVVEDLWYAPRLKAFHTNNNRLSE